MFKKKQPRLCSFERPNYIDVSVGGHYIAGEKIEDGVRELYEETGIKVCYSELIDIGIRRSVFSIDEYKCFEYQYMHLFDLKGRRNFSPDYKEITSFVEINVDKAIKLLLNEVDEIETCIHNAAGVLSSKIRLSDIGPAYIIGDKLMLKLLIIACRYFNDEDTRLLLI